MIDWKAFYANGGYHGDNDPYCYDDGNDEEYEEEDEYEPNDKYPIDSEYESSGPTF